MYFYVTKVFVQNFNLIEFFTFDVLCTSIEKTVKIIRIKNDILIEISNQRQNIICIIDLWEFSALFKRKISANWNILYKHKKKN